MQAMKSGLFIVIILFLGGCSGSDIILDLEDDLDEDVDKDKVVRVSEADLEWMIYPTETGDIRVYIYDDGERVHSGTIQYDELMQEEILWTHSEEESEELSFIIGAIDKNYEPLVSINGEPFDGDVVALDDAYVFFSAYDSALPSSLEVSLEGEKR